MYISNIKIRNWRNFTRADVDLQETVYIIGPNACGKSNLLDVFRFMRDIVNPKGGGLQQALASRGGLTRVRSLAARSKPHLELAFELREDLDDRTGPPDWKYVLSIHSKTGGRNLPHVMKEEAYRHGEQLFSRPDKDDKLDDARLTQTHLEQVNMNRAFRDVANFFEQVLYLHLVPQLLKHTDQIFLPHLESDPFGQGFLEQVSKTTPRTRNARLKKIEDTLRRVIPNLEQLRFVKDPGTGRPHLEMLYNHWRPNSGWQREDQFSDGTLRLIAMLWTLLSSNSVILLEEPELSLHESVVRQIPTLLYKTHKSRKKIGSQIFVTTHSAELLSSTSIDGNFLVLRPGAAGEATAIEQPTEADLLAMRAGMPPADILLPKTAETIKSV